MLRCGWDATSLWGFFFFNDTATTEIYTLSLHDALPISRIRAGDLGVRAHGGRRDAEPGRARGGAAAHGAGARQRGHRGQDRKSTRLNSSHSQISYAVFCLKKKKSRGGIVHPPATARGVA